MANRVISENEVFLGSNYFKTEGQVRASTISRFPAKMITGDYSFMNEQFLSNLIMSDQRGGGMIEEMDESIHTDRYWWSTCNTNYKGHIVLPRLSGNVGTLTGTTFSYANFNGELYLSDGSKFYSLNATGTGLDEILFGGNSITNVTDLTADGDTLILHRSGDTYKMNTSEVVSNASVTVYHLGVHLAGTVYAVRTDTGAFGITTDHGVTWTEKTAFPRIAAGPPRRIFVYQDASANMVVYIAAKSGLWIFDATNDLWLPTHLTSPFETYGGYGATTWQDAAFYSAALGIKKYTVASTATISNVGLDKDDGLPSEYNGEITNIIGGGDNFLYALVSSYITVGTGYSTVMQTDGKGWSCLWADANADKYGGIISPASGKYRLYFDSNKIIYYVDISRGVLNPKKISGYTYAAAGMHIGSWFDAGTAVYPKLATKIKLFVDGVTATETIVVKYRIDHVNTNRDTGWTTLGTINNATSGISGGRGTVTFTFGTNVGIAFKAIQFRFDLATGTSTLTPDIQAVVLSYMKILDLKKGWSFTVNCGEEYKGNKPRQQVAALWTAAETQTLLEFTFRDDSTETYYVKIHPMHGLEPTGPSYQAKYNIMVIEP